MSDAAAQAALFTWIFEKLAAFSTQHFQPEQDPVCLLTKE